MTEEKKANETGKFPEMKTETANHMMITVEGKEGRIYRFSMPFFSPLPECYDAAANVANKIAELYNDAMKKATEKKEESVKEEEAKKA